jgi:hypothetical protein
MGIYITKMPFCKALTGWKLLSLMGRTKVQKSVSGLAFEPMSKAVLFFNGLTEEYEELQADIYGDGNG